MERKERRLKYKGGRVLGMHGPGCMLTSNTSFSYASPRQPSVELRGQDPLFCFDGVGTPYIVGNLPGTVRQFRRVDWAISWPLAHGPTKCSPYTLHTANRRLAHQAISVVRAKHFGSEG